MIVLYGPGGLTVKGSASFTRPLSIATDRSYPRRTSTWPTQASTQNGHPGKAAVTMAQLVATDPDASRRKGEYG
jgi:hypothetical protein